MKIKCELAGFTKIEWGYSREKQPSETRREAKEHVQEKQWCVFDEIYNQNNNQFTKLLPTAQFGGFFE